MSEPDMVRLTAPLGTDEANVGTERYRVHEDGTILVPRAVALALETGPSGFVETDPPPPPSLPLNLMRVRGVPGASATWQGQTFTADDYGIVEIPAAALSALSCHGFRPF